MLPGAAAWGQLMTSSGSSSKSRAETYTLSGTVTNAVTGEPVRRALVQLSSAVQQSVLTDSDGTFTFDNLPAGQAILAARKPGFFSDQDLSQDWPQQPPLLVGPEMSPVMLKLTPESVIFGRVLSLDGEPVEGIRVRAIAARVAEGRRLWETRGETSADEDGQFRIANLQPGAYYVAAGPAMRVGRGRRARHEEGFAPVFYPGVPDMLSTTPIALGAGQQAETDFSVKPETVYRVSGRTLGVPEGTGVGLGLINRSGEHLPLPVEMKSGGEFQARVPAGQYVMEAAATVQQPESAAQPGGVKYVPVQTLKGYVPLVVSSDLTGVQIVLAPLRPIPVSVVLQAASEAADRAGRRRRGPPQLAGVGLTSVSDTLNGRNYWAATDVEGNNASLVLRDVDPGRYSIEINPTGPWYVYSASSGTTDLLRDPLAIVAGARPEPIQIVLRGDGGSINGKIELAGKSSRGVVLLIRDGVSANQIKSQVTGDEGSFQFAQLAPGEYRLLAVDHASGFEYKDPEVLGPYLSRATHVSVQPNEETTARVELVQMGK